jgi:tRNA/rRNA methyltransferase
MNPLDRIYIILVEPKFEDNIGSVARVMKNFGLRNLILVNPRTQITHRAYVLATHASDVLDSAIILKDFEKLVKSFDLLFATSGKVTSSKTKKLRKFITPETMARLIKNSDATRIGIVFGREDLGLTNKEIWLCDHLVHIPTNPEFPILNLSQAVAVVTYELFKQFSELEESPRLANEELKLLFLNRLLSYLNLEEEKKKVILRMLKRAPMFEKEIKRVLAWLK